jgi:putative FmdB family regulatory protein
MPIYEYRCNACGFEKEYLQRLSDAPIVTCEACGQATMSKLISAAGFQLKGSGWYVTDFKNNGSKKKEPDSTKPAETRSETAKDDAKSKAVEGATKETSSEKPTAASTSVPTQQAGG